MKRLIRLIKREDGFSLVWLATILALLLGMAGFATDLGWLYLNTVRAQNAVDAAALAGVVNLPGFSPDADARAAASANGYTHGVNATVIPTPQDDNELLVTLDTFVPYFFMSVLGVDGANITRESTAQYVKPVPLGSPDNCFGGGPGTGCSGTEDFWAAVSGKRTLVEDGDPYSTECVRNERSGSNIACVGINSEYERGGLYGGYYYGIEVQPGSNSLTVEIYDQQFAQRSPISQQTGDSRFSVDPGGQHGPTSIATRFRLYPPDTTPLIPYDHGSTQICTETNASGTINSWSTLCTTQSNPTPGIWLVHVETTNNSAGSNNYSVRASTTGAPNPQVFGINDMSIWSNGLSAGSELWLAEIGEEHAGKTLELEFYDPGDANGTSPSFYRVLTPFGVTPSCTWEFWNYNFSTQLGGGSGSCQWLTSIAGQNDGLYNEQWIRVRVSLPTDPVDMCDEGNNPGEECFWKMDLDLSQPTERTVWRARVIGNPVRLLP